MYDQVPGVTELLSFVSMYPVESMEIHSGVGSHASIDLICGPSSRLIGVPRPYLQVLEREGLLPEEIARRLRQLEIVVGRAAGERA